MNHRATARFWANYARLPKEIQRQADRAYEFLCNNPQHPSLQFKKVGDYWSVRIGLHYRALAIEDGPDFLWVWIGIHEEYDGLIR